jgi:hypothetical protein
MCGGAPARCEQSNHGHARQDFEGRVQAVANDICTRIDKADRLEGSVQPGSERARRRQDA